MTFVSSTLSFFTSGSESLSDWMSGSLEVHIGAVEMIGSDKGIGKICSSSASSKTQLRPKTVRYLTLEINDWSGMSDNVKLLIRGKGK